MYELSRFYVKKKGSKLIDEIIVFDDCSIQFNTKTYWDHLKFKAKNLYYFLFIQQKSEKDSYNKIITENIITTFEVLNNFNKHNGIPTVDYPKKLLEVRTFLSNEKTKHFKITKTKSLKYTKSKVNYIG